MVAVNSLLYFLLSAGLSSNPDQAQDVQGSNSLNGLDLAKLCPPREHLSDCEAHCQKNCTNYNKPITCPDVCVKGCVCDEGLVRSANGKCILPTQCPGRDTCPRGEHYEQCNAHCQRNCSTWGKPLPCPRLCVHGCVCDLGTVRGPNQKCIKPDKCPKKDISEAESQDEISASFRCKANEHFTDCDAYCEKNCTNHDQDVKCRDTCVWGCICDEGYVRGPNKKCILIENCPEVPEPDSHEESAPPSECLLPKDKGSCKATLSYYYFNQVSGQCETFIYGGCQGNKNNFLTKAACERRCLRKTASSESAIESEEHAEVLIGESEEDRVTEERAPPSECLLPKNKGPCRGSVAAYYFNHVRGKCEMFIYGGCMGNSNNFETKGACERMCVGKAASSESAFESEEQAAIRESEEESVSSSEEGAPPSECSLPKDVGTCKKSVPRYFFNKKTQKCEKFIYGGCKGNKNNFKTLEACEKRCTKDVVKECPVKEHMSNCEAHCQKNCTNYNKPIVCPLKCVKGCVCDEGLVRAIDGKCVAPKQCPGKDVCPKGEHYDQCNAHCQRNCTTWGRPLPCPLMCKHGCVCDLGTVRGPKGKCIRPAECPKRSPSSESLFESDEMKVAEIAYEEQDLDMAYESEEEISEVTEEGAPPSECSLPKDVGTCKKSVPRYFFNKKTQKCEKFIYGGCKGNKNNFKTLEACEKRCTKDVVKECPVKEHMSNCEAHCQKNCTNYNKPIVCPLKCVKGCVCDEGLVRAIDGKCVAPKQCPGKDVCPKGEHYDQCNAHCQRNCTTWGRPLPCPLMCKHGCVCDLGTVRGPKGKCINPAQCPKRSPSSESLFESDEMEVAEIAYEEQDLDMAYESEEERSEITEEGAPPSECLLPKDVGTCKKSVPRYFFNKKTQKCEKFIYGGCKGNKNNFKTLEACEKRCTKDVVKECPVKEHMSNCEAHCQKNCTNYNKPIVCPLKCVKGCVCDEGLVRAIDGKCVAPKQCPGKDVCPKGEHYDQCNAHCQRNCTTWGRPLPCPLMCKHGCVCDLGTVRGPKGKCIKPAQCPKRSPFSELDSEEEVVVIAEATADFCPENEVYSRCKAHCQGNCRYTEKICANGFLCVSGCKCKEGYVRGPEGNCILLSECPSKEIPKEYVCPSNEHFDRCTAHCQNNCTTIDKRIPCPRVCVPMCVCDRGYLRGYDGMCILRENCQSPDHFSASSEEVRQQRERTYEEIAEREDSTSIYDEMTPQEEEELSQGVLDQLIPKASIICKEHETFSLRPCPKTCDNYETKKCYIYIPGCECESGYVYGPEGTCIKEEECSGRKQPEDCTELEFYDTCGTACPDDCTNFEQYDRPCPKKCKADCFCLPGFVRGPDGDCIFPFDCPAKSPLFH